METAFKYFNGFSLCVTLSFLLCLSLFLIDNLFLEHPLAILRDTLSFQIRWLLQDTQ